MDRLRDGREGWLKFSLFPSGSNCASHTDGDREDNSSLLCQQPESSMYDVLYVDTFSQISSFFLKSIHFKHWILIYAIGV